MLWPSPGVRVTWRVAKGVVTISCITGIRTQVVPPVRSFDIVQPSRRKVRSCVSMRSVRNMKLLPDVDRTRIVLAVTRVIADRFHADLIAGGNHELRE